METVIYGIINFFIYLIHWSDPSAQASISPRGWRGPTAFEPDSPGTRWLFLCAPLIPESGSEACSKQGLGLLQLQSLSIDARAFSSSVSAPPGEE